MLDTRLQACDASRRRAGVAMVEALIALPLLVLVLIAAPYLHALVRAKQESMTASRVSAWRSALTGCIAASTDFPAPIDTSAIADSAAAHASTKFPGVGDVPLVGPMLEQIVPSTLCQASKRSVQRPVILGLDDDELLSTSCVTCNEVAKDPLEATFEVFTSFLP